MAGVDWVSLLHYMGAAVAAGVVDSFDHEMEIYFEEAEKTKSDGELFKQKRLANNYSREQAANEIGVSCYAVRIYEKGLSVSKQMHEKFDNWQPVQIDFMAFIEKYKLRQKDLAQIVGVDPSMIWAWKNGKYKIPVYAKRALKNWENERIIEERSLTNE